MKITRHLITASACALLGSTALVHATERAPLQDTSDSWLRLAQVAVDCEAQPEAAECLQRTRDAEEEDAAEDENSGEAAPDGNQPSQEPEPEAPEEGEAQSDVAPEAAEPEPALEEPEAAEEEAPAPQAAPVEEEEATEPAPAAERQATEEEADDDEADDETPPPAAEPAPAPEPEAADEVSEPDEQATPETDEEAPADVTPEGEQTEEEAAPAEAPASEEEEAAPETDADSAAEGERAPILDSQKRGNRGDVDGRRGERDRDEQRGDRDRQPAQAEVPAEAEEAPDTDAEAQVEIEADVESITREEGRRIERPSWSERRGDRDEDRSGDRDDRRGERDRDDREDRGDRRESRERGEDSGRVVREFGDRIIIQLGDQIRVERRDRDRRLERDASDVYYEELSNGRTREVVERRNGVRVITIRDRYGDIVHRARVYPDGREVVLFHVSPRNYERLHDHRRAGWDLPPMRLTIPVDEYILEARRVRDREAYYEFLRQPPVERVERTYSVAEVTQSPRIRDKARRIDLDTINFDFNSATISGSEIDKLDDVAWAIAKLLEENPGETFLIEGHTDAVGSDLYNLALSDQRADAVIDAMVNYYELPPENFIAQGYGEQYLKVDTEARNRENRRVAIRRITPLVAPVASAR